MLLGPPSPRPRPRGGRARRSCARPCRSRLPAGPARARAAVSPRASSTLIHPCSAATSSSGCSRTSRRRSNAAAASSWRPSSRVSSATSSAASGSSGSASAIARCGLERLLVLAEHLVHLHQGDGGRGGPFAAPGGLLEHRHGVVLRGPPGRRVVAERRERHLVARARARAPCGTPRSPPRSRPRRRARRRGRATPPPRRSAQLRDPAQLLRGVVGAELDARPAGYAEQLDVVGLLTEPLDGGLAGATEVAPLKVGAGLL